MFLLTVILSEDLIRILNNSAVLKLLISMKLTYRACPGVRVDFNRRTRAGKSTVKKMLNSTITCTIAIDYNISIKPYNFIVSFNLSEVHKEIQFI